MTRQHLLKTYQQQRQLLPLLLLIAYCLNAVIAAVHGRVEMAGDTFLFDLTTKHYIALGAVGLNFIAYFAARPFYKYTLLLTITAGLFNLITFPAVETRQRIALNSLMVTFQPSAFFVGLVTYIVNFKRVNKFVIDNLTNRLTPEEQNKIARAKFKEGVEKFRKKYGNYPEEVLIEIVTAKKFVPEALEAARQLLDEQQPDENTI